MDIQTFDARHAEAQVNGLRMHYVEKGTGPLVVLLHGFPEHWWSWRHQIGPIAAAGFRVVAPDLRGYNATERKGPYDIDTLAADVAALIEALGERRAKIVAHDWGGAIAWHLAATLPSYCERLSALNAPHPAVFYKSLRTSAAQRRRSLYIALFQLPLLPEFVLTRGGGRMIEQTLRDMAVDPASVDAEDIRPFREAIVQPGAASAMLAYYRAVVRRAGLRPGAVTKTPKITAPVQVIWGMEDKALGFYDQVPGIAKYVPRLEVERIENAGHFVQSEKPDAVNARLIPFLQRDFTARDAAQAG